MLYPFEEKSPQVHKDAWIAPTAAVIGAVEVGPGSSIWFHCVARGDVNYIKIGSFTNIQDGTIMHGADEYSVEIGDYVTVGHGARLHGCTIEDMCLIGIGAIILNGAVVRKNTIIAAGSLVPEGKVLESGWLYKGIPAKPFRELTGEEQEKNRYWAEKYMRFALKYQQGDKNPPLQGGLPA
ncbi:MAG: gamma carbonic anhydrase family protein [Candidatus Eremiobacteraeota bacterium]|nr:gamma carbonic anhydrase family protein [Candidatus Eremiobacteraeota bacterium]